MQPCLMTPTYKSHDQQITNCVPATDYCCAGTAQLCLCCSAELADRTILCLTAIMSLGSVPLLLRRDA